jgi:nucleotide-binding universal stress UspA family protein
MTDVTAGPDSRTEPDGELQAVHHRPVALLRRGSPANEIIKAAQQLGAGLVVVASGSRGISETVMLGSTAQRVQQYAPWARYWWSVPPPERGGRAAVKKR